MDYYTKVLLDGRSAKSRRVYRDSEARAASEGRAYVPRQKTARRAGKGVLLPFAGCDGEGGGVNRKGQQHYRLFRAGDQLLFDGNRPLSTVECLNFILSLRKNRIYVGFAFSGYDATQILRDLPLATVARIFRGREEDDRSRYVHWHDFAIDYLPGHYLRVARVDAGNHRVTGSQRTIYETYGFFQGSFVQTLETYGIGTRASRERMAGIKGQRARFNLLTPTEIDYNAEECEYLEELMEELRRRCLRLGLKPRSWNGAGKLAAALLAKNAVLRRADVLQLVPHEVIEAAKYAYYGGRAELVWAGPQDQVWSYDLRSAYPAAMLHCPCLQHGRWHETDLRPAIEGTPGQDAAAKAAAGLASDAVAIVRCEFGHPEDSVWCGLPVRLAGGSLDFPRQGKGGYWWHEIQAAVRLGATVKPLQAWVCTKNCDCQPLGFAREVYEARRRLESQGKGMGIPLKLALNSLYGKFAQRVGAASYQNHLWAGFITAWARAKLLDAIAGASSQKAIIGVATDAVFSREKLTLDEGVALGQWEASERGAVMFLQPGVYFELGRDKTAKPRLVKSRGMDHKAVRKNRKRLRDAWDAWGELHRATEPRAGVPYGWDARGAMRYPKVAIKMRGFIGLRLANARGDLTKAGHWTRGEEAVRNITFHWGAKRQLGEVIEAHDGAHGRSLLTRPYDGMREWSLHWDPAKNSKTATEYRLAEIWLEDQPDCDDPGELLIGGRE